MIAKPAQRVYSLSLEKIEFILPLGLFIIFLAITLPGISWGAPAVWHPDEVVVRSMKALHGEWKFDEINFDYPSLPQYAMFGLGKIILGMGYTDLEVLVAARVLSAILAGLTIILTYFITRRITNNIYMAGLSGLLLLSVSEMTHNGRFAHNDTYITFFVTLAVYFLINYRLSHQRGWLYASFIGIGMAASSKYNGISLVIVPVLLYLYTERHSLRKGPLRVFETLFIGGALTFLGYAAGTPKSFFWMSYYFKRMIPALVHTGNYARQPDSIRGILGQYASFANGVGLPLFILFTAAFLWACYKVFQTYWLKKEGINPTPDMAAVALPPASSTAAGKTIPSALKVEQASRADCLLILLLSVVALDLPIMISYNYPARFFLSMMPISAVLGALFVGDLYRQLQAKGNLAYLRLLTFGLAAILLFSFARNISVMLMFLNDARVPASEFIKTLPAGTSLEHTFYPPVIPLEHFDREHNYPIFFKKSMDDVAPTHKNYVYNAGEAGLVDRVTDYLVADSFTIDRLKDPYICQSMQAECDFFNQLATGQSNHYKLIAQFSYSLPPYLPKLRISFVNPTIRIYERIQ